MEHSVSSDLSTCRAEARSKLKSALLWMCGMEQDSEEQRPPPPPPPEAAVCSLNEEPCLRHVVNANLIVCLSVAVFLFAYWA